MMCKTTEQSLQSGGTLCRGIHGTLCRVITGLLYCGMSGTVCAESPTLEKLFPNPANNSVAFTGDKEFGKDEWLSLYNCLQQKIIEYRLPAKGKTFSFDASVIQQGIYIVKHLSAESIISENKLVIIK